MRIFVSLIVWMIPLGLIGLSGCDGHGHVPDADELEFEKKFDREAVLVKTCGVDWGISTVPLKVYRFKDQLWFKDNLIWRPVAAGIDQVCDVLDIDAKDGARRSRGDRYGPRRANQWFTWRMRLVGGS